MLVFIRHPQAYRSRHRSWTEFGRPAAGMAAGRGHYRQHFGPYAEPQERASVDQPRERQCNWLNPRQGMPLTDSLAVSQRVLLYLVFIQ
jgi:hypothetical protein